jgi:2-iminoacetate synthase ThiH
MKSDGAYKLRHSRQERLNNAYYLTDSSTLMKIKDREIRARKTQSRDYNFEITNKCSNRCD